MVDIPTAEAALATFLKGNPASSIVAMPNTSETFRLVNPWNDTSVAFDIPVGDISDVAEALNQVILPERFSAIYHRDTKSLEVIWTAFKLPVSQVEVSERKFKYKFGRKNHECYFGDASSRLMTIAKYARPVTVSETNHRNISSFSALTRLKNGDKNLTSFDVPRSFWITNCPSKESELISIVQNLNFYMTYYDNQSPSVLIHSPNVPELKSSQKTRYALGTFPSLISGKTIDETILSFWYSARSENNMMKFLLYYRILEYAASHYIDEEAKNLIKRIINNPTALNDLGKTLDAIVSALSTQKLGDAQRLQAVVRRFVEPEIAWKEIEVNLGFFSKDTRFEGGFTAKALVSAKDTNETFSPSRLDGLADAFRKIRNALSHGKDQETAGVIRPTTTNLTLLRPWVHLIEAAAAEVVLYRGITT